MSTISRRAFLRTSGLGIGLGVAGGRAAARPGGVGDGSLQDDRLIVSPGVEFQVEQIDGLTAAGDHVLHAWKAGPQTVALARQLHAMPAGGVFVLSIPPAAFRCPPDRKRAA